MDKMTEFLFMEKIKRSSAPSMAVMIVRLGLNGLSSCGPYLQSNVFFMDDPRVAHYLRTLERIGVSTYKALGHSLSQGQRKSYGKSWIQAQNLHIRMPLRHAPDSLWPNASPKRLRCRCRSELETGAGSDWLHGVFHPGHRRAGTGCALRQPFAPGAGWRSVAPRG